MRVAILAVSLLSLASMDVSRAQGVQTADSTALAVPTVAMNQPSFVVPELVISTRALTHNSVVAAAHRGAAAVVRRGAPTAMHNSGNFGHGPTPASFVAANLVTFQASRFSSDFTDPRTLVSGMAAARNMQTVPQPARSLTDHLLAGVVAIMLIAYQLRRKHRVLRPHPFAA